MADEGSESGQDPNATTAPIDRGSLRCSFCGKVYADVQTMVCGPTPAVAICNECVAAYTEVVAAERGGPSEAA